MHKARDRRLVGQQGVIDFGTELAFFLVERMLGGRGTAAPPRRALTPIERMVVRTVADRITTGVREIWEDYIQLDLRVTGFESVPEILELEINPLMVQAPGRGVIAVDARTGRPCADFGTNGVADIKIGMGEIIPGMVSITSAPTIVRGVIVTGHQVLDGQYRAAPSGVIQGFDAVTGDLKWEYRRRVPDDVGDYFPAAGTIAYVSVGPSAPKAGPTLPTHDTVAPKAVRTSSPSSPSTSVPKKMSPK